jgi:L-asparaginase
MKTNIFTSAILVVAISFQGVFAQKPRVTVLATGGTIAGAGTQSTSSAYQAAQLPIDNLLNAVPEIHNIATLKGEQISQVGSQDMSIDIWLKLAKRIQELFDQNLTDAVVITHGTDTQEETAYFLNLVLKTAKPVILVGAMRSSTAISADGPRNLFNAVTVAVDTASMGKGVLVVMNDKIISARDVTKTHTTAVETFKGGGFGPVGCVEDGQVFFNYDITKKHTSATAFDIRKINALPKVEIVYGYADASPIAIQALMKNKVAGIIMAGVGNGNFNKALGEQIKLATKAGIAVVRASRVGSGRVSLNVEVNDTEFGTLVSEDLNPQKARILLMLGLSQNMSREDLQKLFFTY